MTVNLGSTEWLHPFYKVFSTGNFFPSCEEPLTLRGCFYSVLSSLHYMQQCEGSTTVHQNYFILNNETDCIYLLPCGVVWFEGMKFRGFKASGGNIMLEGEVHAARYFRNKWSSDLCPMLSHVISIAKEKCKWGWREDIVGFVHFAGCSHKRQRCTFTTLISSCFIPSKRIIVLGFLKALWDIIPGNAGDIH